MSQLPTTPDILARIVAHKRHEVDQAKARIPLAQVRASLGAVSDTTPLLAALQRQDLNVIAEVKRRSPSAGGIATIADPVALAADYARGGAVAVSVLTDSEFFGGTLDDLRQVVPAIAPVPVLRKDFIIDDYQIYEAAAAGARIILLIAAILTPAQAWEYHQLARSLGLETIFEIHDLGEYTPFAQHPWPIIGINNRNLRSFVTSLETTLTVAPQLPRSARIISESGFATWQDLAQVRAHVHGYLIGETLAKSGQSAQLLAQWRTQWQADG